MRIKVGETWFTCNPDQPIMIEMNDNDKANISNMSDNAYKYAIFDDSDTRSKEDKLKWMKA